MGRKIFLKKMAIKIRQPIKLVMAVIEIDGISAGMFLSRITSVDQQSVTQRRQKLDWILFKAFPPQTASLQSGKTSFLFFCKIYPLTFNNIPLYQRVIFFQVVLKHNQLRKNTIVIPQKSIM